ncbi:hypothetical protein D1614_04070 [Maribellus luteus]|uniref:DUF4402 domain-containing protein n=1 Tax=Maribellus luteus TaxID=2305463 RepID=A0A399T6Y0_9BACT|nr:hypothetical protein [Maribellus luteus]RIJ49927.1 hypothetical protein D1614_04070 [Maribellus luteus]
MKVAWVLIFLFGGLLANAQYMEVSVDGMVTFDGVDFIINEAGEDYSPSVESESSVYVSIDFQSFWDALFNPNRKWKIEVAKEDLTWNNHVKLEIKRTEDGYGDWSNNKRKTRIKGGDNYQVVDRVSRDFFSGKGSAYFVPLQLKLSGISVTQGAQDFETNVILTIYDD